MQVPKYQWLIEAKAQKCGVKCDKLYIPSDIQPSFQVAFTPENLIDEDFDGDNIGEPVNQTGGVSDTYVFDMSYNPTKDWVNSFTFLVDGVEKCYIFCITDDTVPAFGRVTEYGDFTLIEINNGTGRKTNYINALGARLPNPIAATINVNNIEVTGLPAGTQVVPGDNYPTVSGTGSATWSLNNYFPLNDKACFFNISGFAEIDLPTTTPSIQKSVVVDASNFVTISVNFINSFGFDVDFDMVIMNDSYVVLDTITKTALQGTNTLNFSFTASVSPPPYYILKFQLSDQSVYADSISGEIVGFCLNTIEVNQVPFVDTISYVDCDGVTHVLDVEDWQYNWNEKYNFLITLAGYLPDNFQLIIDGSDGDTFTSVWYAKLPAGYCAGDKILFTWTDSCIFGQIDYANLPFTNELYIPAYLEKSTAVTRERIQSVNTDGSLSNVFDHSLVKYEAKIGVFSADTHEALERAFIHKTLTLDGDGYYVDDSSSYTISAIGNTKYTARIDLIKAGSELIKSLCCC